MKNRGDQQASRNVISQKWTFMLCISSFCAGLLFTNRMWTVSDSKLITRPTALESEGLKLISEGCDLRKNVKRNPKQIFGEVSKTYQAIQTLDKTISSLEMELASARSIQESIVNGSPISEEHSWSSFEKRKYLMVVGVNTAFSSRKRRDSVRATWMPQGEKRKKIRGEGRYNAFCHRSQDFMCQDFYVNH